MTLEALDPAVLAVLPAGCQVLSVTRHGKTNWSTGYKVDVKIDGEENKYFLKVLDRPRADEMAMGEYVSSTTLRQHIPDNIVPPIAWGTFENDPAKSFFLTNFRHLVERLPPTTELLAIVKKLHQSSTSPNGKFGFPVTTFYGPPPMDNTWTDSWEEYYTREFFSSVAYAQGALENDPDLAELAEPFIQKVIPRLLRPLQTGGNSIKPTLCFGDLWDANIQTDAITNQPILFDPCSFYGHHEMDFQCMRASRNTIGQEFVTAYKYEVGASQPEEDFDDRNALYALRNDLRTIGMKSIPELLPTIKEEMRRLLAKHPTGIEGLEVTRDQEVARENDDIDNSSA